MKATIRSVAALAAGCIGIWSATAQAQPSNGWTGTTGNWTDSTWQFGGPPLPAFDGRGMVGWFEDNGTQGASSLVGTVSVNSDIRVSNPSPTVVLGSGANAAGTMNIGASGKFKVILGGGAGSTGVFDVGLNGGTGTLNVSGTLEVDDRLALATAGNAASKITLSGSAIVTADEGFFDRNLVIEGPSVNATFATDVVLGQSGIHNWKIPVGGASTLKVGGNVDLGGTLKVDFPSWTPTVGTTWNLVDSDTVDDGEALPSGFGNIDQSSVLGLIQGNKFVVSQTAGGINGALTQLKLEQHPVLVVNRATGATTLRNYSSSAATVQFDTYVIGSQMGSLKPATWTSIAPSGGWVEANPSTTALSEIIPAPGGFATIAASGTINLGTAVDLPTPSSFGQENEDVTFRFGKLGSSTFTEGRVIYTGIPDNTLTLNVDPNTGQAQILNGTGFSVAIEAYVIDSPNGLLKFANGLPADTWNSLDDQNTSGGMWFEADPNSTQISELLVVGGLTIAPNGAVNLGSPFNDTLAGVEGDLTFRFALVGDSKGDYNENGIIDAADYTVWRDALTAGNNLLPNDPTPGVVNESDFTYWRNHFGESFTPGMLTGKVVYSPLVVLGAGSGSASVSLVPEPGTGILALMGLAGFALARARRRRSNA